MIYLDHNATTPLEPAVADTLAALPAEAYGNPSSAYAVGRVARGLIEGARRDLAAALGVAPAEVFFTSGGTESNNLSLFGALAPERGEALVCAPIEHPSVLESGRELERRGGRLIWLPVDAVGRIRPEDVAAAIDDHTRLVSVAWANNEIGTVQPVREIAAICRRRGVLFHCDAVQAFGKIDVDAAEIDLLSVAAHKLGGPKGIGALVVRRGVSLRPLLFGGKQERGIRPGTENVVGACAFAAAARAAAAAGTWTEELRERLAEGLLSLGECRRYSPREGCLPNTVYVGFAGVRGEALVAALDLEGVAASVGSACAAGSGEPSHVLRAIGCDPETARGGVRFSSGRATTAAEIDTALEIVGRVVERMRATAAA